jgi:hypothetical protein
MSDFSWNSIIAVVLLLVLISYSLQALPHLIFELKFYHHNNWNMSGDSGRRVWLQDKFQKKFSFLPLGVIKFFALANRLLVAVILISVWVRAGLNTVHF